jgi:drug/metabolite transporter (DMT)-like permease
MKKGVALMGLSVFFFAIMNVAVKKVGHLPTFELVFFRSAIAAIIAFATLKIKRIPPWGKRKDLLILRGLFGFFALSMFFATVQNMPLAPALVIQYISPIFVAIFGIFILKEPMRPIQWLWFAIAFAGVAMIKGFGEGVSLFYLCVGILSAMFSGMAYTTVRFLKDTDPADVVVFYFPLVTLPISAIITCFYWETPQGIDWFWLLMTGVFAQLGQVFMTRSLHLEKANIVSSMAYLGIVFGLGFGYFMFDEALTVMAFVGIALVLFGVLMNVFFKGPEDVQAPLEKAG